MRTVELAKVAVAAESLRLRTLASRQGMRAAFGAGAAVFAVAVLVVLHFVLYIGLLHWLTPMVSVLIVLAVDVIAAGILGALAMRNTEDPVETEARAIKAQALIELRRSMTVMSMAAEVGGAVLRSRTRSGMRQGAATMIAEMASRLIGR